MFVEKDPMGELTDYILKNLRKGYTKESLRWALAKQGYSRIEIEKAIIRADKILAEKAPILKTKPEIKYRLVEPKESPDAKKKRFFLSL